LATGAEQTVSINTTVSSDRHGSPFVQAFAVVTSATALPLTTNPVVIAVHH
jgi:hypothetical protein